MEHLWTCMSLCWMIQQIYVQTVHSCLCNPKNEKELNDYVPVQLCGQLCSSSAGTDSTWPAWRWGAGARGTFFSPSSTQASRIRSRWEEPEGRKQVIYIKVTKHLWCDVIEKRGCVLLHSSYTTATCQRSQFSLFLLLLKNDTPYYLSIYSHVQRYGTAVKHILLI